MQFCNFAPRLQNFTNEIYYGPSECHQLYINRVFSQKQQQQQKKPLDFRDHAYEQFYAMHE